MELTRDQMNSIRLIVEGNKENLLDESVVIQSFAAGKISGIKNVLKTLGVDLREVMNSSLIED